MNAKTIKNLKITRIVLFMALSIVTFSIRSQVTIGDVAAPQKYSVLEISTVITKGGLRLPHLTRAQRDALEASPEFQAENHQGNALSSIAPGLGLGLTIFNTDENCVEYWNGKNWVSLCEGSSSMTISPEPCININVDGTNCDDKFDINDPQCLNGPFSITIAAGSSYAHLYDVDEYNGSFRIVFQSNNSINDRSAVVRVTSSCTGLFKDFLFIQEGQTCNPSLGLFAPDITAIPSGKNISICEGGAVYLAVPASTPNLSDVIWTRNNIEIARGVSSITVTQPGVYDVWLDFIYCGQLPGNAVTVTKDGTGAPDPVAIVVTGNNGLVCGPGGTARLIAQKPTASGTVRWFKNGVLQTLTSPDNIIDATVGQWFAVISDGNCWSVPSNAVSVIEDTGTSGSLTMPVVEKGSSFCAGSLVQLSVSTASYNSSYTYTWYENNTQIGTGRYIMYNVPTNTNSVVIRCRATQSNTCGSEAISEEAITIGTIPGSPFITGNTTLCSGTATMNVVPAEAGTYTYAWYKDNQLIATTQSITVTEGGDYYATVTGTGGCSSPAAFRNIPTVSSATPAVTLHRSDNFGTVYQYDIVTYTATLALSNSPATYKWTVTGATLISGDNTSTIVVSFDQTGTATVSVEVNNACGTGTATDNPTVIPDCADPVSVTPDGNVTVNAVAGIGTTLGPVSVTFANGATPTPSYQWYRNTINSSTGGTPIPGATNNAYVVNESVAGTYYYYLQVSNANCASSTLTSAVCQVIVSPNPANLPLGAGTLTGVTCFDINKSNFDTNCGAQAGRTSAATNFATLGSVTYTFTASSSGTKSNLRFMVIDVESVIDTWTGNDIPGTVANNQTATLTINYRKDLSDVNGLIYGRSRDYAAKVKLYAVYYNGTQDVAVPLTVSIQDCSCCMGYLAIGKEYVQKTAGYLTGISASSSFATIASFFNATGKDVCFYKNDYGSLAASLSSATSNCNGMTEGGGGWRLPTIAELGSIQSVATSLSSQPTSISGTTNMANSPQSGTGAYYWSSSTYNSSSTWGWSYGQGTTQPISVSNRVRCVKTQ